MSVWYITLLASAAAIAVEARYLDELDIIAQNTKDAASEAQAQLEVYQRMIGPFQTYAGMAPSVKEAIDCPRPPIKKAKLSLKVASFVPDRKVYKPARRLLDKIKKIDLTLKVASLAMILVVRNAAADIERLEQANRTLDEFRSILGQVTPIVDAGMESTRYLDVILTFWAYMESDTVQRALQAGARRFKEVVADMVVKRLTTTYTAPFEFFFKREAQRTGHQRAYYSSYRVENAVVGIMKDALSKVARNVDGAATKLLSMSQEQQGSHVTKFFYSKALSFVGLAVKLFVRAQQEGIGHATRDVMEEAVKDVLTSAAETMVAAARRTFLDLFDLGERKFPTPQDLRMGPVREATIEHCSSKLAHVLSGITSTVAANVSNILSESERLTRRGMAPAESMRHSIHTVMTQRLSALETSVLRALAFGDASTQQDIFGAGLLAGTFSEVSMEQVRQAAEKSLTVPLDDVPSVVSAAVSKATAASAQLVKTGSPLVMLGMLAGEVGAGSWVSGVKEVLRHVAAASATEAYEEVSEAVLVSTMEAADIGLESFVSQAMQRVGLKGASGVSAATAASMRANATLKGSLERSHSGVQYDMEDVTRESMDAFFYALGPGEKPAGAEQVEVEISRTLRPVADVSSVFVAALKKAGEVLRVAEEQNAQALKLAIRFEAGLGKVCKATKQLNNASLKLIDLLRNDGVCFSLPDSADVCLDGSRWGLRKKCLSESLPFQDCTSADALSANNFCGNIPDDCSGGACLSDHDELKRCVDSGAVDEARSAAMEQAMSLADFNATELERDLDENIEKDYTEEPVPEINVDFGLPSLEAAELSAEGGGMLKGWMSKAPSLPAVELASKCVPWVKATFRLADVQDAEVLVDESKFKGAIARSLLEVTRLTSEELLVNISTVPGRSAPEVLVSVFARVVPTSWTTTFHTKHVIREALQEETLAPKLTSEIRRSLLRLTFVADVAEVSEPRVVISTGLEDEVVFVSAVRRNIGMHAIAAVFLVIGLVAVC